MSEQTCRCGRPTRDNAYVCDTCADKLEIALGDTPFTIQELDTTITQQRAASLEPAIPSANVGIRWHERAATERRELTKLLALWVKLAHDDKVRRIGGSDNLPAATPAAMSRWLLCRVEGLKFHPAGQDAVEEIVDQVRSARHIIFWKRSARDYLGACETVSDDDQICEGDVYADQGAQVAYCDDCDAGFTVVIRKADLNKRLDDRLCTPAEIAIYAVHLGLEQPRDTVRNKVNYWSRHKRITQRGTALNGDPTFRYGEVRPLLYSEFSRKVKS